MQIELTDEEKATLLECIDWDAYSTTNRDALLSLEKKTLIERGAGRYGFGWGLTDKGRNYVKELRSCRSK